MYAERDEPCEALSVHSGRVVPPGPFSVGLARARVMTKFPCGILGLMRKTGRLFHSLSDGQRCAEKELRRESMAVLESQTQLGSVKTRPLTHVLRVRLSRVDSRVS